MTNPETITRQSTLGDVLYAQDSGALIAEAQWVMWLRAIAAGDPRALRDLFETTYPVIFTFISHIVGDREAAERLTVEVFHDVWGQAATFDSAFGSVLGWIMRHAHSKAIHHLSQRNESCEHGNASEGAETKVVVATAGAAQR